MCVSPVAKNCTDINGHSYIKFFPCNKCVECKAHYQNDWKVRMSSEFERFHGKGVFFTITYRDDSEYLNILNPKDDSGNFIPNEYAGKTYQLHTKNGVITKTYDGISRSIDKKPIQDWIKRFRRKYEYHHNAVANFSYFITSEYGPGSFRPHIHGLFFGLTKDDVTAMFLEANDLFGRSTYDNINTDFARGQSVGSAADYVSKYCSKGEFECPLTYDKDNVRGYVVPPCFHLISKGIGDNYITSNRISDYLRLSDQDKFTGPKIIPSEIEQLLHRQTVSFNKYCRRLAADPYRVDVINDEKFIPIVSESQLFSRSFVEKVALSLFVYYSDKKSGKSFRYSMPRFYKEKIFKPCSPTRLKFYEKTDPERYKLELLKKSPSFAILQSQISALLLDKSFELCVDESRKLQADNPSWSFDEAFSVAAQNQIKAHQYKTNSVRMALNNRYIKSSI